VLANLSGRTVTAAKRGADMVAATHAAFEGLGRGLAARSEKRLGARRERAPGRSGARGEGEEEETGERGEAKLA
jgi:hypothetical protein